MRLPALLLTTTTTTSLSGPASRSPPQYDQSYNVRVITESHELTLQTHLIALIWTTVEHL